MNGRCLSEPAGLRYARGAAARICTGLRLTEDPEMVFVEGMVLEDMPAWKEAVGNTSEAAEAEHENKPRWR